MSPELKLLGDVKYVLLPPWGISELNAIKVVHNLHCLSLFEGDLDVVIPFEDVDYLFWELCQEAEAVHEEFLRVDVVEGSYCVSQDAVQAVKVTDKLLRLLVGLRETYGFVRFFFAINEEACH